MSTDLVDTYRSTYGDIFVAPAPISVQGVDVIFDLLVLGYGSHKGMVVDKDWGKLQQFGLALTEMGYGYSCMELGDNIEGFAAVLEDWGREGT